MNRIEEKHVTRIFKRFKDRYGSQSYAFWLGIDDVNDRAATWLEDLNAKRISPERIAAALTILGDHHAGRVPNIFEFIRVCEASAGLIPQENLATISLDAKPDPERLQSIKSRIVENKTKNSDWAIRLLQRSLTESQIASISIRTALEALKNHGRLYELPDDLKARYGAAINSAKEVM